MKYLRAFVSASLGLSLGFVPTRAFAQTCFSSTVACVTGWNGTSTGVGVAGQSTAGLAVKGLDTNGGIGTSGASTNGIGVDAIDSGSGVGLQASSSTGYGIDATSGGTYAIYAHNNVNHPAIYAEGDDSDGVQAHSARSNVGAGIYAWNSTTTGYGGYFQINNGSGTVGGAADAVVGDNPSSSGYAGYFTGRVYVATGLTVNGTCVAGTCTSDERLKTQIKPMTGSLQILSNLRPVTYYWKNPEKDQSNKLQRGFIAQDVEKVLPEWVGLNDLGNKTLDTAGLVPMLVDSVRTGVALILITPPSEFVPTSLVA